MANIAFLGAGSTIFAKNVLGDVMLTPALEDSHIRLHDIDPVRLQDSKNMLDNINRNNGGNPIAMMFLICRHVNFRFRIWRLITVVLLLNAI